MAEANPHAKLDALQQRHDELAKKSRELEANLVEIEAHANKTTGRIRIPEISAEIQDREARSDRRTR